MAKENDGYETFDSLNGIHKGGSSSQGLEDSKSYKGSPGSSGEGKPDSDAVVVEKGSK